jgi:hypothetical protein
MAVIDLEVASKTIPGIGDAQLECKHDLYGNLWLDFPQAFADPSLFHGEHITKTCVLTEEGRRVLRIANNRHDIIRRLGDSGLSGSFIYTPGTDGPIREVSDASSSLKNLFKKYSAQAVEKSFISIDGSVPISGWEMVQLLQGMEPYATELGFNFIRPLGATDSSMYLPLLEGKTFDKFLPQIPEERRKKILEQFDRDAPRLNRSLFIFTKEQLEKNGFRMIGTVDAEIRNQVLDNEYTEFVNADGSLHILLIIEIANGNFYVRTRNWMVPIETQIKVQQLVPYDLVEAYRELKSGIIVFDPIRIFGIRDS